MFSGDDEFKVVGDGLALFVRKRCKCDHIIVPSVVFSSDGEKYKIIGIESQINQHYDFSETITFDESSEIEIIPFSFIYKSKLFFYLPPKIKRIINDTEENLYFKRRKKIHFDNHKFVSVLYNKIIINHHPLELVSDLSHKPRTLVRETVRIIGVHCYSCYLIQSVVIPPSVEVIEDHAFYQCINLINVRFKGKSRLKKICTNAFSYTLIKKFCFPPSVEEIGNEAFVSCYELSAISFPKDSKLKKIGESSFKDLKIQSVDFPGSVEQIESNSFNECDKLSAISFPEDSKLKIIGESSFKRSKIQAVSFPASIEEISDNAFMYCADLVSISFPEDSRLKIIGEKSFLNAKIKSVTFPASLEEIRNGAFGGCLKLISIIFPGDSKLRSIGEIAFFHTGIQEIVFPASLEEIKAYAFMFTKIVSIKYLGVKSQIKIDDSAFASNPSFKKYN